MKAKELVELRAMDPLDRLKQYRELAVAAVADKHRKSVCKARLHRTLVPRLQHLIAARNAPADAPGPANAQVLGTCIVRRHPKINGINYI
jgi:hypothetical protein